MQLVPNNAPACLQRAVDLILKIYKWKTCLFYLYDVISFSNNVEDYIKHIEEIFLTLVDVEVTPKITNCYFFQLQV